MLGSISAQLASVVADLNPDSIPSYLAVSTYEAFDQIERLAATGKTLLARRVDDSREWARRGFATPEEYLAATSGSSVGAARDALTTSKKVNDLPVVEQAMRDGVLSLTQANAVAEAAAADPRAQSRLIHKAKKVSLKELRDECQRTKAAVDPDPDATHRRIYQQ